MTRNVVLIAGNDGVGKSTTAKNIAASKRHLKCHIMSFADPLRNIVGKELGILPEELKKQQVKSMIISGTDITVRQYMIDTATKIRQTDDSYFANETADRIREVPDENDITIIDDFRFNICHETMKSRGYNVIVLGLLIEGQPYDKTKYNDISMHVDEWVSRKSDGNFDIDLICRIINDRVMLSE